MPQPLTLREEVIREVSNVQQTVTPVPADDVDRGLPEPWKRPGDYGYGL